MIVTIDRMEGELAVLELADGTTQTTPVTALPAGAREGSKLEVTEGGYLLRDDLKEDAKSRILAKMARLKNKAK